MAGEYIADPATKDTELTRDDLRRVIANGPKPLRNERALGHLLSRMLATVDAHQRAMTSLHRQVQIMQLESSTKGAPTTLDPGTAAQFLPQSYFDERANEHLRALLAEAEELRDALIDAQRRVTSRVNAITYAVTTLNEDPDMPADVRDKLLDLVRSMPETDPVPVPDDSALRNAVAAVPPPQPPPPPPVAAGGPAAATADDSGLDDLFGDPA
jgi:hypothetical protein